MNDSTLAAFDGYFTSLDKKATSGKIDLEKYPRLITKLEEWFNHYQVTKNKLPFFQDDRN